jgi:hypothetical protein
LSKTSSSAPILPLPLTSPDSLPLEAAIHATRLTPAAGAVVLAHGLVLWNPVLSLEKTFIRPTLPWGQANFNHFVKSTLPSMIIHTENDTHVPFAVSSDACREHANCELLTMEASNHLFDAPGTQAQVIDLTVTWLQKICKSPP